MTQCRAEKERNSSKNTKITATLEATETRVTSWLISLWAATLKTGTPAIDSRKPPPAADSAHRSLRG